MALMVGLLAARHRQTGQEQLSPLERLASHLKALIESGFRQE
ncbi:MAG: hypothetical protein R3B05_00450 [Nitrospira sp.]